MRRVVVTVRAQRQFDAAFKWWLRNRDKAPDAFLADFAELLVAIAENPAIGPIARTRQRNVRKILMQRVRYYLYYRVVSDDAVEIIALWHASRRPPQL